MRRLGWVLTPVWGCLLWISGAQAEFRVETQPQHPAPGEVFQVRVVGVSPQGMLEARLGSHAFALWRVPSGEWEGVAAVDRDEAAPTRDVLFLDVGPSGETLAGVHELRFRSRDYGVQRISVDESKVTLSAPDQKRVDEENAAILAVLAQRTQDRLWSLPFRMPVAGDITGPFGVRRVYNGKAKGYHNGIDISAPRGTPVAAAAAGRVVLVGDYFMTGRTVVLDHGLGLHTAYFHMDSAAVVEGEAVEAGAVVGLVGSTGRSTGAHLHWGVYVSGVRGDPESLLQVSAGIAAR